MSTIIKLFVGLILVSHGFIHLLYLMRRPRGAKKWPFTLSYSWLLSRLGLSESVVRRIGLVALGLTILGFVLVGLALFHFFGLQEYWTSLVLGATVASLAVLLLFWNIQLITGVAIDLVLLYFVLARDWTP